MPSSSTAPVAGQRGQRRHRGVDLELVVPVVVDVGDAVAVARWSVAPHRRIAPHRTRSLAFVPAYLDHAASTPMRPEAVEAMAPFLQRPLRQLRRAPTPPPARPARPSTRRATSWPTPSAAAPARSSSPAAAPRPTTTPSSAPCAATAASRCAAPSSTTPCSHPVEHVGGRVVGVDGAGRIDLDALAAALDRRRDASSRSCWPTTRSARCSRSPRWPSWCGPRRPRAVAAHRRRAGVRVARRRRRRRRRRLRQRQRPQVRRPQGRRRARRAGRRRPRAAHPRRRPGARPAQRHATTSPASWPWPRPCAATVAERPTTVARVGGPARPAGRRPRWPRVAGRARDRAPRRRRSPARPTCASTGSRARRCCSCSTGPASARRPRRRAPAGPWSRRTC